MAPAPSINIIYVPADCGSILPGKSKAPAAFQNINIIRKIQHAGFQGIVEYDALGSPARYSATGFSIGSVRNEDLNICVCERVYSAVDNHANRYHDNPPFQLILGGECGMAPAILSALWHDAESQDPPQRVGLLYIDADTDLASPSDPDSTGIFAGMNMTHLIRSSGALRSMEKFSRRTGEPVCDAGNTVLFGTNMAHPGNKAEHFAYLFDNNYKVVSSASVARDPEQRAREALEYLEESVDNIMVHLDVDSIDPHMFPLANVPNFTGVTFEQMMRALKVILGSGKVCGLTIAEVNPDHDPELKMLDRLTDEIVEILAARVKALTSEA